MANMDIVRAVSTVLSDHVLKVTAPKKKGKRPWKWAYQTVVFPEVRCPYCKEVASSNAVWFIEKESTLIGQAIPVAGKKFVVESPDHPHAEEYSGIICFGTARDSINALFGSLNHHARYLRKSGGYGGVPQWLGGKYFNHSCKTVDAYMGKGGGLPIEEDILDDDEDEDEGGDYEYHCEACGDGMNDGEDWEFADALYCKDCFDARAFMCGNCGGTIDLEEKYVTPDGGAAYCNGCFYEKYFYCDGCDQDIVIEEQRTEGDHLDVCKECFAKPEFVICECGDWYYNDNAWAVDYHKGEGHGVVGPQVTT